LGQSTAKHGCFGRCRPLDHHFARPARRDRARDRPGRLNLIVCPHLLAELIGVLRREKFRSYLTIEEADRYVAGLTSRAETRPDPAAVTPIARDPKDDYLIALARESAADAIVTGDNDLLVLDLLEPPVVNPVRSCSNLGSLRKDWRLRA
jgi:putative PIN family toxin of toxin-antitoxin system